MRTSRNLVWALGALGLAVGAALVPLLASSQFESDRGLWIALTLVIGWGFVATGAFAWLRRPDSRVGALMVITGFAWYLGVAYRTDVPLLFTLGLLSGHLFAGAAIHLLLAFPSGRLQDLADRVLVGIGYAAVTLGVWIPTLFTDPAQLGCPECPRNLVLVSADAAFVARWLDGLSILGIAVLLAVLARMVGRWLDASSPMRRIITPVFAAGGVLVVMLVALLVSDLAGASPETVDVIFYATLVPFAAVPYVFLAGLVRTRMLRGGTVGWLVAALGDATGKLALRDALARALGDPSIELAYWLPQSGQYVDAARRRVQLPAPGSGRAVHEVALDGSPVAAIIHDPTLLDDAELVDAAGAAAALALERERLEVELRAKVDELSESRARMLKFGMTERRRLERDLHDGAQQRLVSLALDLRLAREKVRSDPEGAEELLGGAANELAGALEELRELARGIHPALLSDRGLAPAIETLARRSQLPVEVEVDPRLDGEIPEPIELAAYFLVAEALTNVVKYARASRAAVRLCRDGGGIVVTVTDDGVGGAELGKGSGLRGLADRISTLGGRLEIDSSPGAGTTVRATIPHD